jgi:phosphoglycolate phosphatase-like HAD superfamily hydrolase
MTAMAYELAAELPKTLVLWDIDHTLIENGGVSKETYALAFELLTGSEPAVQPVTDGRTDFQIMHELLAANSLATDKYVSIAQFETVLADAMTSKASELPQRGYVLGGVMDALKTLASVPTVIQSVLTGNIMCNAAAKLSPFALDSWVDLDVGGYGSDDIVRANLVEAARRKVQKKYGVRFDSSSTVLIGDTPLDVKAAHDGGARVIAVATGVYGADVLEHAGADVTLDSLDDIEAFVQELVALRSRH